MKTEEQITYWLEIAEYDFITAKAMLKAKRYLYVGFMCHQVIEKALKAYYVHKNSQIPPYSHNLPNLSHLSNLYNSMSEQFKDFLDELLPLNIESRYPTYKEELLKKLNYNYCTDLLKRTEELYKWIKSKLLKN